MAEGVAAVFLLLPFALPDLRRLGALSLAIALVPLVAAAALSVLGLGIDEYVLSGLAVGLGTIVDNGAIVVGLRDLRSLASLLPSLRSSLMTTLIVLVPLFFLDFVAPGIRRISLSMSLLLVVAFVGTVLVLPAFTLPAAATPRRKPANEAPRRLPPFRPPARGERCTPRFGGAPSGPRPFSPGPASSSPRSAAPPSR